jgi:CxxC motif-containing protein (DUF1111 family)
VGKSLFGSIGCAQCHTETLGRVAGLYSDLLLHDMGSDLESGSGGYATRDPAPSSDDDSFDDRERPRPSEWRTPPLWGIADSAPYLHDGRAATLEDAITAHGGEAAGVTARFRELSQPQQQAMIAFLHTLRAPPVSPGLADPHALAVR